MKTLSESLFDVDVATKEIGVLDVIVSHIENYLGGKTTAYGWVGCIREIEKVIDYKKSKEWKIIPEKVLEDEIYINISNACITLIGWGLTGGYNSYKVVPPIVRIQYNPSLENIWLDIYQTKTVDYKNVIASLKFDWYKLGESSVKNFVDNVLNKVDFEL